MRREFRRERIGRGERPGNAERRLEAALRGIQLAPIQLDDADRLVVLEDVPLQGEPVGAIALGQRLEDGE